MPREHPHDDTFEACAFCESRFEMNVSYPVHTEYEGGEVRLYSFCDDGCMDRWLAEHDGAASDD